MVTEPQVLDLQPTYVGEAFSLVHEVPQIGTIIEMQDPWAKRVDTMPATLPNENGPFVCLTGDEAVQVLAKVDNGYLGGMTLGVTRDCEMILLGFERYVVQSFDGSPQSWCRAIVVSSGSIHGNYRETYETTKKKMVKRICKVLAIQPTYYKQFISDWNSNRHY